MLAEMRKLGASARITAKIAGGASMFGQLVNGTGINVGERNIVATREALAAAKIRSSPRTRDSTTVAACTST
jgi:chemotaxis receptor (MCP) glutamine deamidase CheD